MHAATVATAAPSAAHACMWCGKAFAKQCVAESPGDLCPMSLPSHKGHAVASDRAQVRAQGQVTGLKDRVYCIHVSTMLRVRKDRTDCGRDVRRWKIRWFVFKATEDSMVRLCTR